ncbi:MAG: serine/threonine protein kinase [Myxococcales bacterium]|nr:serine/threonine protein kinase [Myxococcales bacterium]
MRRRPAREREDVSCDSNPRTPDSDEVTSTIHAFRVGECLRERYQILAHIGSGGMADVFHAWDELFHRDVAVKVLKLRRVNEAMKQRVLREARATCAVDHPHLLRITDMGFAGEAPYLVADMLRGHSLAEELRLAPGGRIAWRRAIELLLPPMAALHAAHEAGLVHRDLKPENLFLHHRRDGSEVPMVLDFGIVKHVDVEGKGQRWTQSGMILGTAAYMAPEQACGDPITPRSDVYSMGVTLYRLISGEHLFPLSTGGNAIEAMTRHIYEPPPRLVARGLPRALVEAVYDAVAKQPARRHPSMAAFAAVLAACLTETSAPKPAPRIHPWTYCGAAVVSALVAERLWIGPVERACGVELPPTVAVDEAARPDERSADELGEGDAYCEEAWPEEPPEQVCSSVETELADARSAEPAARARRPPFSRLPNAAGAVRRCLRTYGDPEAARLKVRVVLRADGRVAAASIPGDPDSPLLADCVGRALAGLRFDPAGPSAHEHIYRFRRESP